MPEARTQYGTYVGREVSGQVDEFLGIPFAQAPVGRQRWAAPQPLAAATPASKIAAQQFAPACMQGPHIANWYKGVIESFGGDATRFPSPEVSEDCLYLNIWRPRGRQETALPVFVFIHGGSNKGGWSYEPNYIGRELAQQGVVVVSVAYRLGVFGFFSHPDLAQANFALQDQIAALQWIKNNIASVGGDPSRVTVAGESAGASNIAYLMAAPSARELFARAIHQSGGWAMYRTAAKASLEPLGVKFAQMASGQDMPTLKQLRKIQASTLLSVAESVYADHFFDPVIDGDTVLKPLAESAALGELAAVDLMIGTNANESRMYLAKGATLESWASDNITDLNQRFGLQQIKDKLTAAPETKPLDKLDQLATSYNYTCPSFALANANAQSANRTWFYNFTKQRDGELGAQMGAYHGAELPYVFNTHDEWLPTSAQDRALTQSLGRYWVNFIRSGNPNSERLPDWQAYTKPGDPVQFLGNQIVSAAHPSNELCEILR